MKRQKLNKKLSILLVCLMMVFLVGCGANNTTDNGGSSAEPNVSADTADGNTGTQDDVASGSETGVGTGSEAETGITGNNTNTNANGTGTTGNNTNANGAGTAVTGTAQASEANPINDDITGYYSETVAYPLLENEIIDELDYENLDMTGTRYYYNYIDLNDDGVDEILVQLNGEYNTTDNGDTLLIVEQKRAYNDDEDDGFDVEKIYTAFVNPVIISDHKTNGYRDIIFMNTDGTYSKIEYGKDDYKDMRNAVILQNLDGITGVALLCNDVANDTANNTGLYFS